MQEWLAKQDPTVLVALVGLLSAIVSALVGALVANHQTTRQFELELRKSGVERTHALGEEYLSRAREHSEDVYIPLSSAIARLKSSYKRYQFNGRRPLDLAGFEQEVAAFIAELERLERRGATAFVTTELEERTLSFANFLRASQSSTDIEMHSFVDYNLGGGLAGAQFAGKANFSGKTAARLAPLAKTTLRIPGITLAVSTTDLIRAPFASEEFQARFERDTHLISVLVKEVTLGVPAKNPREQS